RQSTRHRPAHSSQIRLIHKALLDLISLMNFNAQIAFKSGKSAHYDPGISGKRAGNQLSGKRPGSAQSSSTVLSAAGLISSSRATRAAFAAIAAAIEGSSGSRKRRMTEIREAARGHGHAWRTIERAKHKLGIGSINDPESLAKEGVPPKPCWFWELPTE